MDYSLFKEEDFCQDIEFIRWVVSPTYESNRFWNDFMATYPNKKKEIQLAKGYIEMLNFQEIEPSTEELLRLKQRICDDITTPVRQLQWWNRPMYWAAAVVALLVVSVSVLWWNQQPATYETAYGEIRKIELADGSVVTLNANSVLKVANKSIREVWLEGEAYFDIAKLNGTKFIVHTPEAQVEVLGTEFNVTTRRKRTQVVLHEGKVKLYAPNVATVVMKPGDMAEVGNKTKAIQLKIVQPEMYDAWKESLVVLNDKPVSEIVAILEDTYGITIQFEDPLLLKKKLTGKLSLKSTDDFVENLATILDAEIEKTEKGYLLR